MIYLVVSLFLLDVLLLTYFVEKIHHYLAATLLCVLTGLCFVFLGKTYALATLDWVRENPIFLIIGFISYFMLGLIIVINPWGGRWYWFVRRVMKANQSFKEDWLKGWHKNVEYIGKGIQALEKDTRPKTPQDEKYIKDLKDKLQAWQESRGKMTKDLLPYWKEKEADIRTSEVPGDKITKPKPQEHKVMITAWITWWPLCLLNLIFNEFFNYISEKLYTGATEILNRITNRLWKDDDFES